MMQYLNSKELQAGFQRVVFDMLLAKRASEAREDGLMTAAEAREIRSRP